MGLDKSFRFSKGFAVKYELGEEVGRGYFGYISSAKAKKGELKGKGVIIKVIPKVKITSKHYSVKAVKDHYKFTTMEIFLVLPNMTYINDIKAVYYNICGVVRLATANLKAKAGCLGDDFRSLMIEEVL